MREHNRPIVVTHVDGACYPNPGRGGFGVVLRCGKVQKCLSGRIPEKPTTNQRAEIHAAIAALTALKAPCKVTLFSDSQYLTETMNGYYRRSSNLDLWDRLEEVAAPHEVEWVWERGHAGAQDNELAHRLAEQQAGRAA